MPEALSSCLVREIYRKKDRRLDEIQMDREKTLHNTQNSRKKDRKIEKQKDRKAEKQKDRKTEKQKDRKQEDRKTETEKRKHRKTERKKNRHLF